MSEAKRVLYDQCHRMWMPVYLVSFLVYAAIGFPLALLSGGGELIATAYTVIAIILAAFTPVVVDTIYFEIRNRAIMKRYYEELAQEERTAND